MISPNPPIIIRRWLLFDADDICIIYQHDDVTKMKIFYVKSFCHYAVCL